MKRFKWLKIHRPTSCSPEVWGILRMFRDVFETATLLATLRSPMLDPCKSESLLIHNSSYARVLLPIEYKKSGRIDQFSNGDAVEPHMAQHVRYSSTRKTPSTLDNLQRKMLSMERLKGEPVSIDYPIVKQFSRKCPPATPFNPNPSRIFSIAIVSSEMDKDILPFVMNTCKFPLLL